MSRDQWIIVGVAGAALLVYAQRNKPAGVPLLAWTFRGLGFDPNYVPPPPQRSIAIANQTIQPAFQGGDISPSMLRVPAADSPFTAPFIFY